MKLKGLLFAAESGGFKPAHPPSESMHLLVHGGAGGQPTSPIARQAVLDEAVADGLATDSPQAAVCAAVNRLERSPRFNAGRGGTVQTDGRFRSDAGLMTSTGDIGAVCNVTGVLHPIDLAAAVKDETPHILLGPDGAMALAEHRGIDTDTDLGTDRMRERYEAAAVPDGFADELAFVVDTFDVDDEATERDTVGAVATDGEVLAAATSTGGRWLALRGRIGDVPQVGCGFFASDVGAVSTTGNGEAIAQTTLARLVERRLAAGDDVESATMAAMATFERETDATAGVIAVDREGAIATAFNSARMQTAAGSTR